MSLLNSWEFGAIFAAIFIILATSLKWKFSYWARKNIPYVAPTIPFGGVKISVGEHVKNAYDELKSRGCAYGGIFNFGSPVFIPVSLKQLKNIIQKDFQYFTDRGIYYNEKAEPLMVHLLTLEGQKWYNLRTKLTPTFTSGKMKMMFETLIACSYHMREVVAELANKKHPLDIKEVAACFTTDVIGSCAFGLDCNSFKNPDAEFRKCGKMMLDFPVYMQMLRLLLHSYPSLGKLFGIKIMPKIASDFFLKSISDTVKYREENNVNRKDMLNILIDLKNKGSNDFENKSERSGLTIHEIAAQALAFFLAGFESSSSTLTFCLFELATNPEVQDKVRKEIEQVLEKYDGKITYESIMDMKYMAQVVEETLRKHPPAPLIVRRCVKDYRIPDSDVIIEKGTGVFISILGLHHDVRYFPDPEKFDPERFSPENRDQIPQFAFIPFGEGPRICIGLRFGLMQVKVGLATLLKDFKYSLNSKTVLPLKTDPTKPLNTSINAIFLDVTTLSS